MEVFLEDSLGYVLLNGVHVDFFSESSNTSFFNGSLRSVNLSPRSPVKDPSNGKSLKNLFCDFPMYPLVSVVTFGDEAVK
jgi:hypothetical protein